MSDPPIFVASLGASTAIGRDAWASAAAVRAGVAGFTEHPFMVDRIGKPMIVAAAPWLEIELDYVERLKALLFPALQQAISPLLEANGDTPLRTVLSLGLPSPRPGLPDDLAAQLASALRERFGATFSALATFPNGHASGVFALEAGVKALTQGGCDACVVAGVDSYIEPQMLEWLEECDQLHGAGALNNAWGFVPGEAAGALLIVRQERLAQVRAAPLARILAVGSAFESKQIKTESVCIGEGLTQAFRAALGALPEGLRVSDVYCDMNGEPYRADEFGFSALRTKESFESVSAFVAPADCWGDVAAGGAPLHLMLASVAGSKGYARGQLALTWASAEGGHRGAILAAVSRGR